MNYRRCRRRSAPERLLGIWPGKRPGICAHQGICDILDNLSVYDILDKWYKCPRPYLYRGRPPVNLFLTPRISVGSGVVFCNW